MTEKSMQLTWRFLLCWLNLGLSFIKFDCTAEIPRSLYTTFMKVLKLISLLLLTACTQMNQSKDLNRLQELSEKTGIEMVVIDEAEKITGTKAEHFKRWLIGSSYASDSIQSSVRQEYPRTKTVLLPGVTFFRRS